MPVLPKKLAASAVTLLAGGLAFVIASAVGWGARDAGDLFQVRNSTGADLALQKSGKGIFSEPLIAQGGHILVSPDALKRCEFSDGKKMWRYDFDPASIDLRKFRKDGFRRDDLDPFLYFLEIRNDRTLQVESRASASGPVFPGFPLPPVEAGSPPLAVEAPRVVLYVQTAPREISRYFLMPSGRAVRDDYSEAQELRLKPGAVETLAQALEHCGICELQKDVRAPFGVGKPDMTIELPPESRMCNARLSWDDWSHDAHAKACLDAVHAALAPLSAQCTACKFP